MLFRSKYLLRVFNVKRNPIDSEVLTSWLEEIDLSIEDVAFDDLDLKIEVESDETDETENDRINNTEEECKIVFKFDSMMHESVLQRLNAIKKDMDFRTNEAVLLKLLEGYEL